uniref:CNNM transmembrane domain-containing protein n=1 Tax=Neobodo designis TaxID=312471 RepID=A0A7S1LL04_NEODS
MRWAFASFALCLALLCVAVAAQETAEGDGMFGVPVTSNASGYSPPAAAESGESSKKISTGTLVGYIIADIILLCGAALFAGLTLSIMGLDTLSLEIIATSGQEPDRTYAEKILPIRRLGNQLLCTLILGNVMVNTLIAQITDRFVSGWVGVALSTALITVGGEILPQATMSAHAMRVGAGSAPIVRFFLVLFYPICKPISLFLDRAIGNDPGQIYEREELKKLFALHAQEHGAASGIADSDLNLLFGAMDLGSVTVGDVMTPMADIFMLEASERLDSNQLQNIWQSGHSRIPVFKTSRMNIVGVLYAKDLLMVNPEEESRIHDFVKFHRRHIIAVSADTTLTMMLRQFQTGSSHIALVRRVAIRGNADPVYEAVGIVTLDDVIARLIGDEIRDDENDNADDVDDHAAMIQAAMPHLNVAVAPAHNFHGPMVTAAAAALYGTMAARNDRTLGPVSGAALRLVRAASVTGNHRKATVLFLRESVPQFASFDAATLADFVASHGMIYEVIAPSCARGLRTTSKRNVWLYKIGCASTMFTLIIQGAVQVILPAATSDPTAAPATNASASASAGLGSPVVPAVPHTKSEPLFMELPSWSVLGAPVLDGARGHGVTGTYLPDYSARVVANTTILQFHLSDLARFFGDFSSSSSITSSRHHPPA